MSDIQLYLFEADKDKNEATRIAVGTARRMVPAHMLTSHFAYRIWDVGLESKELKLVDVIESLGEYLNHNDAPLRAKSTEDSSSSPINILTSIAMSYIAEVLQA